MTFIIQSTYLQVYHIYIYTIIQNSIILSQVVLGIYLRSKQHIYIYIQSVKLIMITYNKCAKLTRIQNIVCAPPQNWNQPLEDDDMRISVKHWKGRSIWSSYFTQSAIATHGRQYVERSVCWTNLMKTNPKKIFCPKILCQTDSLSTWSFVRLRNRQ